jgi:O-antigen/teichoic acid export membrane protein
MPRVRRSSSRERDSRPVRSRIVTVQPDASPPPQLVPPPGSEGLSAVEYCRSVFARAQASKFVRDSLALLVLNLLSRAIGLFASAYALRCLGPENVGLSAVVLTMALQVGLTYNGGFDTVAIRRIAAGRERIRSVTHTIVTSRGVLAVGAAVIWVAVVAMSPGLSHRGLWLLGALLMFLPALSLVFAFNGAERLPVQSAIATGGALVTAFAYLAFFRPGMPLGADLVVGAVAAVLTTACSWVAYRHAFEHWPVGRTSLVELRDLLRESWRYWVLAVATFLYSTFQIPLVAYYLGPRDTGLFRSAFLLAATIELFFNSINALLLPRLVAWKALGLPVLWRRQRKLLGLFALIGTPATLLLIAVAPLIYRVFLGSDFLAAIPIFRILVLSRLVVFLGQIYAFGLAAIGLDGAFLTASLVGGVASPLLSMIVLPRMGVIGAAYVTLASELLVVTLCFLAQRRYIRSVRAVGASAPE